MSRQNGGEHKGRDASAKAGPSCPKLGDHGVSVQPIQHGTTSAVSLPTAELSKLSIYEGPNNSRNTALRGVVVTRPAIRQRLDFALLEEQALKTRPITAVTKQGSSGEPVRLLTNHFPIMTKMEWTILQYRVDFSEDIDDMRIKRQLVAQQSERIGKSYLFDGTMIFSTKIIALPNKTLYLVGKVESDNRPVNIRIKYVGKIDRQDLVYLQVFNILMRRCMRKLKLQLVGRNMYDAMAAIKLSQFKMEVWPGYLTSIRQHDGGIMMICEFSSKVIRQDTAYDLLVDVSRNYTNNTVEAYRRAMIGQIVMTPYNNKTYKIDDVDFDSSPESTFEMENKQKISYANYYYKRYNRAIQNRSQPLLVSRSNTRPGQTSLLRLVPELCVMTGLTQSMRDDFNLMKNLNAVTKLDPNDRANRLIMFNQRLHSIPEIIEEFNGFDMQLKKNILEVPGRVLKPEDIICGDGEVVKSDRNGDWTKAIQSKKMLLPEKIRRWVLICPNKCKSEARHWLENLLQRVARPLGIDLDYPEVYYVENDYAKTLVDAVDRIVARGRPNLIMAILCSANEEKYNAFKKKCYIDRGVLSQVMLAKNLNSRNCMTIATKLAIQMSCKLGGSAWAVAGMPAGAMIVGFDVYHDFNNRKSSYGALVATQNSAMTEWFSTVASHKSGEELSQSIPTDIAKAVQGWYELNGYLPQRIVIYRDGVGDGMLKQVFEHEVANIQKALTHLYDGDRWKMTCIIVTKRINTRFFTVNRRNPVPGTVVDDVVTQPEKYDFFLVSQSVQTGTATPTCYNIISDNSDWSPDHLQRLSFKLAHLYYNVSSSIRVPAPCKYAHRLAYLAGQNLHAEVHPQLARKLYYL